MNMYLVHLVFLPNQREKLCNNLQNHQKCVEDIYEVFKRCKSEEKEYSETPFQVVAR